MTAGNDGSLQEMGGLVAGDAGVTAGDEGGWLQGLGGGMTAGDVGADCSR